MYIVFSKKFFPMDNRTITQESVIFFRKAYVKGSFTSKQTIDLFCLNISIVILDNNW